MLAFVVTATVVMGATGALYLLTEQHEEYAHTFVRTGVIVGAIASCLMLYPTGDNAAGNVAFHQPVALAAMEGLFHSAKGALLAIFGQPDMRNQTLDNPLVLPATAGPIDCSTARRSASVGATNRWMMPAPISKPSRTA